MIDRLRCSFEEPGFEKWTVLQFSATIFKMFVPFGDCSETVSGVILLQTTENDRRDLATGLHDRWYDWNDRPYLETDHLD